MTAEGVPDAPQAADRRRAIADRNVHAIMFSAGPGKTDFVVIGSAWSAGAVPVQQLDATVEVGATRKTIRVIGDRTCEFRPNQAPRFSDPIPFVEMPIRYERAYGGTEETSVPGFLFMYPRNPRGTDVALANSAGNFS